MRLTAIPPARPLRSGTYPTQGPGAVRPHAPSVAGGNSITWDNNGNMTAGNGRTIAWDGENRPASITQGAAVVSFIYGPDGSRLRKIYNPGGGAPVKTS